MSKIQQVKIPVTLDDNYCHYSDLPSVEAYRKPDLPSAIIITEVEIDRSSDLDAKLDQLEILAGLKAQGNFNWKLVRSGDGLTKHSVDILWIEWNEDGTFKEKHNDFTIGRSLLMSPFNEFFTWQTTPITKIITRRPTADIFYLKFETKNSEYRLSRIYEEAIGNPI